MFKFDDIFNLNLNLKASLRPRYTSQFRSRFFFIFNVNFMGNFFPSQDFIFRAPFEMLIDLKSKLALKWRLHLGIWITGFILRFNHVKFSRESSKFYCQIPTKSMFLFWKWVFPKGGNGSTGYTISGLTMPWIQFQDWEQLQQLREIEIPSRFFSPHRISKAVLQTPEYKSSTWTISF